ncbi:hypothetical protein G9A89_016960 [Geosiphon pyriformis]|nr:hypothetical protein G9A89_016960 [Geosiphon pyriformis]
MAGRSGRRGFDLVGNVIFFGLTWTKISRLLISDLPKLNGSFPMTTTLALRSFLLLTQTKNLINAEEAIKGLLGQTFFCLGREHLSDQIKHHLIFSIQYLMRENLLDKNGQLLNLAGAVTHLHYTEPSNFAFVVLYKHGVWHKICRDVETNSKDVMDMLMLVLSNLFNIIPIRRLGKAWISTLRKKYPSRIVLDPIPTSVQQILDMHNDRVIKIYSTYVITFAQNIIELDDKLPLSNMRFPFEYIDLNGELLSQLKSTCVPYVARSSFMAICSGQGDLFRNIYDLTSHLRSSIFLEARSVPFIDTDRYLNAYLFDFFLHGQQKALIEANGIRGGEIWKFLKDFSYILNAICVSLNTLDGVDENVLKGFKLVREEFEAKFQSIWA